ncbi:sporulation factor SpoIIGA [Scopulibacillus darangshiensis]|uniref:Sporulation sigma-E factor-processing peptidase n=1 Tax=Scopulibacillus darangshiensis TaxID=442528 RepID=A0A4R2P2X9_9BACL|nr:sigma-E processing peptidase SpoIIGA [Scopulibacillus darangshiensis]TCP29099.1 sporulation factor SpoIIGA [Scopulibacillus darangshiensis]
MTVYLDVIWLLNLFIDFMLLKLTSVILKRPVRPWRMLLGTLYASSIVLFLFTPLAPIFYHPIGKLVFSAVIIFITFGYRRLSLFAQSFLTFYFSAFMIGGGLFAVHYFFLSSESYASQKAFSTLSYGDPVSWLFVVFGFPVLWIFSKKRIDNLIIKKWRASEQAEVTIKVLGVTIKTTGMIDSGNKLYDPLSRTPVMFLSKEASHGLLPETLFNEGGDLYSMMTDESLNKDWLSRLTMIPYRAVNGSNELVTAFRPDEVVISHGGTVLLSPKVAVALTEHRLSGEGDFHCILHPDMMLHGKTIETAS